MTHDELVEKVARALAYLNDDDDGDWESYYSDAKVAIATIREALQKPTGEMYDSAHKHCEGEAYLPHGLWQAMLAASPLASTALRERE